MRTLFESVDVGTSFSILAHEMYSDSRCTLGDRNDTEPSIQSSVALISHVAEHQGVKAKKT